MPHSSHSAGNNRIEDETQTKIYQPIGQPEYWVVRAPWSSINPLVGMSIHLPNEVTDLLTSLDGSLGCVCMGCWTEYWFLNHDNAFCFYMVYG